MRIGMRVGAAIAAVVAVGALLVAAGTASATGSTARAAGQGVAAGTITFSFDVTEKNGDPRDVSGSFRAAGIPPANTLIAPQGPASCVDVQGKTAGLLYPLARGSKPVASEALSILITAQDGGPGRPDAIGFLGPLPTAAFPGCAPSVAFLPVTQGNITVGS